MEAKFGVAQAEPARLCSAGQSGCRGVVGNYQQSLDLLFLLLELKDITRSLDWVILLFALI
jgi:hypothetical protein